MKVSAEGSAAALILMGGYEACKELYRDYTAFEESKHRAEMDDVNKLYRLWVPDFPPIFNQDKSSSSIQSMHFTDEQIEAMKNPLPTDPAPELRGYRKLVSAAILKVRAWYQERIKIQGNEARNDITAGVLSWLLYILETHCLQFEGRPIDIEDIEKIISFICGWCSLKHSEHTARFSNMGPVHELLKDAADRLREHHDSLSLQETIPVLSKSCIDESDCLMRLFVKLFVPEEYVYLADSVFEQELYQGKLRSRTIRRQFLGLKLHNDEIRLDGFTARWISILAKQSLGAAGLLKANSSLPLRTPEQLFMIPNTQSIRYALAINENFLTTQHKKPIEDPDVLNKRMKIIQEIAILIQKTVYLQTLCTSLSECAKELGNIYIRNPHHLVRFFSDLNALAAQIMHLGKSIKKAIMDIHTENGNTMNLAEFAELPQMITGSLQRLQTTLETTTATIRKHRYSSGQNIDVKKATQDATHQLLEDAIYCEKANGLIPFSVKEEKEESPGPSDQKANEPHLNGIHGSLYQADILLEKICQRIFLIIAKQENENPAIWLALLKSLQEMHLKVLKLLYPLPDSVQPVATERNLHILNLTLHLFEEIQAFVSLEDSTLKQHAGELSNTIQIELSRRDNSLYIDDHQWRFLKVAYSLFPCRFFQTDTRQKLSDVSECFRQIAGRP